MRRDHGIAAPDFLLVECRNALLTKVARRELQRAEGESAERALEEIESAIAVLPSLPLLCQAFTIGLDLAEPIYDCIYLAAALAIDCKLVTSDARLAAKVARSHLGQNRVAPLDTLRTWAKPP